MPEYAVGTRVHLHPDAWADGDRYGEIVTVGPDWVDVRGDLSGKVHEKVPIAHVEEWPGERKWT